MRNDVIDGIKNNLPRIVFERKIVLSDLASQMGMPYATLHGIVNGNKKGVTFAQMAAICRALDIQVGDAYELAEAES